MQRDQVFNVVGLRGNGDRIVITKDTTQKTAERVMSLMTGGSGFVELFIEADDEREMASIDCGSVTFADPAPAGFGEGN